ncbi:hypothetical protein LXL81_07165 [Dyadobacter sp. CY356]|nr:hypothetical protein [Dyadobacter sp. CY356]
MPANTDNVRWLLANMSPQIGDPAQLLDALIDISNMCKYFEERADLVPAAPTGDKAAALEIMLRRKKNTEEGLNWKVVKNWTELDHMLAATLKEDDIIINALQENTAPDDLVKALEPFAKIWGVSGMKRSNPDDLGIWTSDGNIGNNHRVTLGDCKRASEALAAHKSKTQGGE